MEINVNNIDICRLPKCNCGANVNLGFYSEGDLKEFMLEIKSKHTLIDMRELSELYEKIFEDVKSKT